jgi:hypothetical protein
MVWMDNHHVLPKTVLSVFPKQRLYRAFALASKQTLSRNDERQEKFLRDFTAEERRQILQILKDESYLGDEEDVRKWTAKYPINEDWKPFCEYYLGLKFKEKFQQLKRFLRIDWHDY